MQIVIDIDDDLYTRLFDNGVDNYDDAVDMAKAIRKGTSLPKGHGHLIDKRELEKFAFEHDIGSNALDGSLIYDAGETERGDIIWKPLFEAISTIIEADKVESEE